MAAKIIVLLEPEGVDPDSALRVSLSALADSLHADVGICRTANDVSAAVQACGQRGAVIVASPMVERPLSLSRRIAKAHPHTHFVLMSDPGREETLRREATFGAPAGGRWAIHSASEPLEPLVASALDASAQQSKFRTTLDQVALRVAPRASMDAGEIRRLVVSDRYLASVLLHAHDAIVSLDQGGHVISWNSGAQRMFGQADASVRGRMFSALFEEFDSFDALMTMARNGQGKPGAHSSWPRPSAGRATSMRCSIAWRTTQEESPVSSSSCATSLNSIGLSRHLSTAIARRTNFSRCSATNCAIRSRPFATPHA